ncbi:nitronate monooxygenase [Paenibacillus sp. ACRRY]|uniref:NAD(P)H-dependent flavin oxidoreductase n=1 Tax=Paenibacillus sp. ACRRY TaxID=2918208 RepID=UPI001EF72F51|nr:nitronate monooxygenase [Paenibacillus sp. ACRRY]MCG7381369.1 nitronate monooxygenase [Paenibacillus sp. ACRRY]
MKTTSRVEQILGIKYPIIQAAMSWITDATMVAAVSNAGGLGVLGPHGGYNTPPTGGTTEAGERLRKEIRKIKSLTDKSFALNLLMPQEGWDKYARTTFDVALEEGVKYFVGVGYVNKEMINEIKSKGGTLIFRELTPTANGAKQAEAHGADIIIATGYDEGGWLPQNRIGTFSIVPTIVDAVSIPVLATGGINDVRGVRAAFSLGAEGVYVGTRFIVSEECPASDIVKQDIIQSTGSDLLFVSTMQRSTPGPFARDLAATYRTPEDSAVNEQKIGAVGGLLPGMLLGKPSEGISSVNTAIDLIKEVKSCKEIIHELMIDFIEE